MNDEPHQPVSDGKLNQRGTGKSNSTLAGGIKSIFFRLAWILLLPCFYTYGLRRQRRYLG